MPTYLLAALLLLLYTLGSMTPQMAQNALTNRLRAAYGPFEALDVAVLTDPPVRALGGQVDSLRIQARGFAIQGVPVASATLETGSLSVPTLPLLLGAAPALSGPLLATASAELTEEALDAVAHSEQVTRQLQGIPIQFSLFPGLPPITRKVDVKLDKLHLQAGRLAVEGTLELGGTARLAFAASAQPALVAPNLVQLLDIQATMMGNPIPPSYLAGASPTLDLNAHQVPGARYALTSLALSPGRLMVSASVELAQVLR